MKNKLIALVFISVLGLSIAPVAYADHSWGGYHWARTSNPFVLRVGDNVTGAWDSVLRAAASEWSLSAVLDMSVVAGQSNKSCRPTLGKIEVCNGKYGNNGWLGLTSINITGGEHITQATTKFNDTYFSKAPYNVPAWRNLVACHELGHTLGLDHRDTVFDNANLGTCLDYANDPTTNQHADAHDYDMLEQIYAHLDPITTITTPVSTKGGRFEASEDPSSWGSIVGKDAKGRNNKFEKDLGNGNKIVTHVYWAD